MSRVGGTAGWNPDTSVVPAFSAVQRRLSWHRGTAWEAEVLLLLQQQALFAAWPPWR